MTSFTERARTISRWILGIVFILAGANHFIMPTFYERIVPPYLPAPAALVAISGVFEVLGGVGVLIPALRRAAGWGLIALLIAVFPANLYMATHSVQPLSVHVPQWAAWLRLPLQVVMIWWVWWTVLKARPGSTPLVPDPPPSLARA